MAMTNKYFYITKYNEKQYQDVFTQIISTTNATWVLIRSACIWQAMLSSNEIRITKKCVKRL